MAVDNFNGTKVLGRIIQVDHAQNYKKKTDVKDEVSKSEARIISNFSFEFSSMIQNQNFGNLPMDDREAKRLRKKLRRERETSKERCARKAKKL